MILIDIALYKDRAYFIIFDGEVKRFPVELSERELMDWVRRTPCIVERDFTTEKVREGISIQYGFKFVRKLTDEEVNELLNEYGDDYTAYLKGRYIYLEHPILKRTFRIRWDYSLNAYRLYQILRERKYVKLKALARVVMGEYLSGLIFKVVEAVEVIP